MALRPSRLADGQVECFPCLGSMRYIHFEKLLPPGIEVFDRDRIGGWHIKPDLYPIKRAVGLNIEPIALDHELLIIPGRGHVKFLDLVRDILPCLKQ